MNNVKQRFQNKLLSKKALVYAAALTAALGLVCVFYFTGLGCPIRRVTGIPCPACGFSRALFYLLRLDFEKSLYYYPPAAPLAAAAALYIFADLTGKKRRALDLCLALTGVLVFAVYLFRLLTNAIP